MAIASQWRTREQTVDLGVTKTIFMGLDYASAKAGLELAGHSVSPAQWRGMRIMENAALETLNGG